MADEAEEGHSWCWELLPWGKLDIEVRVHSTAVRGNLIYIFGGYVNETSCSQTMFVVDIDKHTVSPLPTYGDVPSARAYHTAEFVGKDMYVMGGATFNRSIYNDLHVFHSDTLQWEELNPPGDLPGPRCGHSMWVMGENLFVLGGSNLDTHYYNDLWMYNTRTNTWQEIATSGQVPEPRNSFALSLVDNDVYIFGGQTQHEKVTNDFYKLDLRTMEWFCLHKYKKINNSKDNNNNNNKEKEEKNQNNNDKQKEAEVLPVSIGIPRERVDHRSCVLHKKIIYTFGAWLDTAGYSTYRAWNDVYCFDTETNEWRELKAHAAARSGHSAVLAGSKIYVIGGLREGFIADNALYALHVPPSERTLVDLCIETVRKHNLYSKGFASSTCAIVTLPKELEERLSN